MKRILALSLCVAILITGLPIFCSVTALAEQGQAEYMPSIPQDAVEFQGHYYKYFADKMEWSDAENYCEDLGGHLVTISNEAENLFVNSLNEENKFWTEATMAEKGVWIGAAEVQEGVWQWVTGKPFEYSNFYPGEPNNEWNVEDCLEMYPDGSWNDLSSNWILPFICEWDVDTTDIPSPTGASVSITEDEYLVWQNMVTEISARVTNESSTAITWSSSDSSVISFGEAELRVVLSDNKDEDETASYWISGIKMTALKAGTAIITAKTASGAISRRRVTVMEYKDGVSLDTHQYILKLGDTIPFFATVSHCGNSVVNFTWRTSNKSVVSFEDDVDTLSVTVLKPGIRKPSVNLIAKAEGTATITCTLWNGESVSKEVTVSSDNTNTLVSNYYNTPVTTPDAKSTLQQDAEDWYKKCNNYLTKLKETVDEKRSPDSNEKGEKLKDFVNLMKAADEEKNGTYINFEFNIEDIFSSNTFPNNWKNYAYDALANYIFSRCKSINLQSAGLNESKIISELNSTLKTGSFDKTYGDVVVTIKGLSFGSFFCEMTCYNKNDSGKKYKFPVCSTYDSAKEALYNFYNEVQSVKEDALNEVYNAIFKDISKIALSTFTDSYLNSHFPAEVTSALSKKGLGNLRNVLSHFYDYNSKVYSKINTAEAITDAMVDEVKENLKNVSSLPSVSGLGTQKSALVTAEQTIKDHLNNYNNGTITSPTPWYEKAYNCIKKIFINCPVSVSVLDQNGTQIGYVSDDDIWFDEDIYIEYNSGSKIIYCPPDLDISLTATGTDAGKLCCSVENYQDGVPVGRSNYYDIYLSKGLVIDFINNDLSESGVDLEVNGVKKDPNEYISAYEDACVEIETANLSLPIGHVYGGGYYTRGDGVVVAAEPSPGYKFCGWYNKKGQIVSFDSVYEFTARNDEKLYALFSEKHEYNIYLEFSGASLILQNNPKVNFAVKKDLLDSIGYENPYAVFFVGENEITVSEYTTNDKYFVFSLDEVPSDILNSEISATLYASRGSAVSYGSSITSTALDFGTQGRDLNEDGVIDILDLVRLENMLSGVSVPEESEDTFDLDFTGTFDVLDLVYLRKMLLVLLKHFSSP
ncbi:MAG: hypothetical protein IKI29_07265 [Clostridia bacterium]|nr:hypothetical protein [Clostridia bacterium]